MSTTTRERRGSLISKTKKDRKYVQPSPRMLRTKTPSVNELRKKFKESPKGKRKLDFLANGPLAGKSFYLDLCGYRHLAQLKKAIKRLSGGVEEFFHKDVTYLVTNRINVANGKSPSSQSAPSPATPSPLLVSQSSSVKSTTVPSPMSTDSPQGIENRQVKPCHNTRGQTIANIVSGGRKRGTIDILSNATTWGVTVCHVERVMKWLAKLMPVTSETSTGMQPSSSKTKRSIEGKVPKVVPLQDTFLKVEDLSFNYRPLVHEFKTWPEITFNGSVICPFDPPRRRSSENNTSKKKIVSKSFKKIAVAERPKHGYCECCEVRYTDLQTHLKGEQHQTFAKTDSNYTSLDKAINSGQSIQDFLNEIRCKSKTIHDSEPQEEKKSSSGDQEMDDDVFLLSSPKRKPKEKQKIISKKSPCLNEMNSKPTTKVDHENTSAVVESLGLNSRVKCEGSETPPLYSSNNREAVQVSDGTLRSPDKNLDGRLKCDGSETPPLYSSNNGETAGASHETLRPPDNQKNYISKNVGKYDEDAGMNGGQRGKGMCDNKQFQPNCSKNSGSSPNEHNKTNVLECLMTLNKISPTKLGPRSPEYIGQGENVKDDGRSSSRRKLHGSLELSPILPCDARRSVFSSCSFEENFHPPNLLIYSSLGSSLGDVSREVNFLVERIGNHRHSDVNSEDMDRKSTELSSPRPNSPPKNLNLCSGSASLKPFINSEHDCVKSENENITPLVKRKRSPNNQEDEQTKEKKYKRLSQASGSEDSCEDDCYRSSVAERVKLQRALFESLQEYNRSEKEVDPPSSTTKDPPSSTTKASRKRQHSSPFAELTNKCCNRRARAKSDGRLRGSGAKNQWSKKCRSKTPMSACLIPNDPFSFND